MNIINLTRKLFSPNAIALIIENHRNLIERGNSIWQLLNNSKLILTSNQLMKRYYSTMTDRKSINEFNSHLLVLQVEHIEDKMSQFLNEFVCVDYDERVGQ